MNKRNRNLKVINNLSRSPVEKVISDPEIKPVSITRFTYTIEGESHPCLVDIAEYEYYEGLKCMKANGIPRSATYPDYLEGHGFIVTCAVVMVIISQEDYPEIERVNALPG